MKPVHASLRAPCGADALFRWVDDLGRYPQWLELVRRADPVAAGTWTVVLAAQLGPLRRSKQLTMVRTELDAGRRARFERREADGKDHAAWVLEARVRPLDAGEDGAGPDGVGSELTMTMRYDGQWWAPLIERVLADEIARARPRLLALAAG